MRRQLFEEVLVQLDSARMEALETGPASVAERIEEVLIPFIEGERDQARG